MLLIWLCRARNDTGDSMASRLFAHSLTTFRPVLWIFSVSWSTAMLLGAHTSTGLPTHKSPSYKRTNNVNVIQMWRRLILSPVALTGEVVNDSGRGDGLPSPWRTLNQTERPLQHRLHSINLFKFLFKQNKTKQKGSLSFLFLRI